MNTFCAKKRFVDRTDQRSSHRARVADPEFIKALDAALLHYADKLTAQGSMDIPASAAYYQRIVGAREFAGVLLNLAEEPQVTARNTNGNLNHKA